MEWTQKDMETSHCAFETWILPDEDYELLLYTLKNISIADIQGLER